MQVSGSAPATTEYITTAALLEHADGRCAAWASILSDVFAGQGVDRGTLRTIVPKPHPLFTVGGFEIIPGIRAQGGWPGWRWFSNHAVVVIGGTIDHPDTIYDPSYGRIYTADASQSALSKWEDFSVWELIYWYPDEDGVEVRVPNTMGDEQTMFEPLP